MNSLSDFPDRLSPMLVKELRQGLRAKTFIIVFLSLQIALLLILFSAGAAASTDNAGTIISSVIFVFFAIAVLLIQPLRAIGAISSEIKGNTIDMMVLTKLDASRIVYGKWSALVGQSALLLATIIPYLILRYFFGGMNLIGEIVLLLLIFLTSMSLTAIMIGLSGSSSFILRTIIPLCAAPVLLYGALFAMFGGMSGGTSIFDVCSLADNNSRIGVAIYIAAIAYLGWSLLSLGASLIAPAAENHATLRRLIVLAVSLIATGVVFTPYFGSYFFWLLFTVIALPAVSTALTEKSFIVPTVREPFLKLGPAGKFAELLLRPGWPSGVFFTLVLSAILLVPLANPSFGNTTFTPDEKTTGLAILGALLFPAVILILARTEEATRVSSYLLILIGSGVFMLIMLTMSEAMNNEDLLYFFIWNPLTLIPIALENSADDRHVPLIALLVDCLYLFILIAIAIRKMWPGDSARSLEEPKPTESSHS